MTERKDVQGRRAGKFRFETLKREGVITSSGDRWHGIRVEHHVLGPGEVQGAVSPNHLISVQLAAEYTCEVYWPGRGWKAETLPRWRIQLLPARLPFAGNWQQCEALSVQIAPELLAGLSQGVIASPIELIPTANMEDPFIAELVKALHDDVKSDSPMGNLYGETLTTALAAHLVRQHSTTPRDLDSAHSLSKVLLSHVVDHIDSQLEAPISLQELATLAQTDAYRFSRMFKRSVGMPPHQFIIRRRVDRAKDLLKSTTLPVGEIALRCGFSSQSHFATMFRRITGITPKAFRDATR